MTEKTASKVSIPKIYLDLDGVFANLDKAMVRLLQCHHWRDITPGKFWEAVETVPNFFYTLEVIEDSLPILYELSKHHTFDTLEVLTAVPRQRPEGYLATCVEDKVQWVQDVLKSEMKVNTIQGGVNKKVFAEKYPGAILVDDTLRNISAWEEAGGIGILHTDTQSTLEKLRVVGALPKQ